MATATLDIIGEIGFETSSDSVRSALRQMPKDTDNIVVNIESLGGSVSDALAIHDMLSVHPANVEVNIIGMTASAATIIAMAGDTIKMSDNALMLIHNASTIALGDKGVMEATMKDLSAIDGRIANIYAKRTGADAAQISEWMSAGGGLGEWWTAEEAKERGFVNEVFEPKVKAVAKIDIETLNKFKLPGLPEQHKTKVKAMAEETKTPETVVNETSLAEKIVNGIKSFFAAEKKAEEVTEPKVEETEPIQATAEMDAVNAKLAEMQAALSASQAEIERLKAVPKAARTEDVDPEAPAKKETPTPKVAFFNQLAGRLNASQVKNTRVAQKKEEVIESQDKN